MLDLNTVVFGDWSRKDVKEIALTIYVHRDTAHELIDNMKIKVGGNSIRIDNSDKFKHYNKKRWRMVQVYL